MRRPSYFLALLVFPCLLFADTYLVPGDYPSIQDAIDAAVNGDTVLVHPGTYVENIDFLGKAIKVEGQQGADFTFIDGNRKGSVVTFANEEDKDARLTGFTITNGSGTYHEPSYPWGGYAGGGVYCEGASPAIENCLFLKNSVSSGYSWYDWGGGICNLNSSPSLLNCSFVKNGAKTYGGGMYSDEQSFPVLTDCTFHENSSYMGGGMYNIKMKAVLTGCTFTENTAERGGGMYIIDGNPDLIECRFSRNIADTYGGAIHGDAEAQHCFFTDNRAQRGGAVKGNLSGSHCAFTGNVAEYGGAVEGYLNGSDHTISGNEALVEGGGINGYLNADYCTISGNTAENGGGVNGGGWGSHFTVRGNHATYDGGGLRVNASFYNLKDGIISKNSAGRNGGGIHGENHYHYKGFERCLITENFAGNDGGGIYHRDVIAPTYSGPLYLSCRITGNRAANGGGGMAIVQSEFLLARCTFIRNEALSGGGVFSYLSDMILANSLIIRNAADSGGGVTLCGGEPELKNCTFHGNAATLKGGGIYCWAYANAHVLNSILCNDHAPAGKEIWIGETGEHAKVIMRFSDLVGGKHTVYIHPMSALKLGDAVINADPLFADPVSGDYHLLYPSPCRNAGYNFFIHDLYDFEDDARVTDKIVDMGADEFHHHLYSMGEAVPGGEIVLNLTAKPLQSATLFIGTEVTANPITTPFGTFHLTLPVTPLDMGTVPWSGHLSLRERIPPSCPIPLTIPMQALVQDKLTNLCTITVEGP